MSKMTQVGGDAWFWHDAENFIILQNVNRAALAADDLAFFA